MTETLLDYLFIGSGPANLAAANFLLENTHHRFLIIEGGTSLVDRKCPGVRVARCVHCAQDSCPTINGVGGSSALFGNKLCHFPASSGAATHVGNSEVATTLTHMESRFERTFGNLSKLSVDSRGRKSYKSDVLTRSQYRDLLEGLLEEPLGRGLIRSCDPVVEIRQVNQGGFRVVTQRGTCYLTRKLVLGTGRSSHEFLRSTFRSLGVKFEESSQDLGLRLEAPSTTFGEGLYYQEDPKFKFQHPGLGSSRTFCGCVGGIVVPVKFGGAYYADGAFGETKGPLSNLAFMVRGLQPLAPEALEAWCAVVNRHSERGLMLGEVELAGGKPEKLASEIVSTVPSWPTSEHRTMMLELLRRTLGRTSALNRLEGSETIRVFGPAIDRFWPRPRLTRKFETSIAGLFVLGDAAGLSRGVVQALATGFSWSRMQRAEPGIRHLRTVSSAPSKISEWCVSV